MDGGAKRRRGGGVLDDFTPTVCWPPMHDGRPDAARMYWLEHARLRATEVRVTPSASTILATYLG